MRFAREVIPANRVEGRFAGICASTISMDAGCAEIGVRLAYGLELNNNQVIKALVEVNLGIAILSWRTVETEVLAGRLSSLRVSGLALERPLTLVSRKSHTLSRPASAFRSVLLTGISIGNHSLKNNEPQ